MERGQLFQWRKKYLTLQWHITAKCLNRCAHCYMYDSDEYNSEVANELQMDDCLKVLDNFCQVAKSLNIPARISFTGGDPFLKPEIFDLIEYASKKDITVGILGNPEFLDDKTVIKLKNLGVKYYQLSIDGMKEKHDGFRSEGSFERTLMAIRLLNKVGISSAVMFTLSKQNANELISVIRLVAKEGVAIFDFDRVVPMGAGIQFKNEMMDPKEFRSLLLNVLEEYKRLKDNGCNTLFGRREYLWKLLYQELGLLKPLSKNKQIIFGGCSIGISILTLLANGIVYPCRRLPIKLGKVPEEDLRNVFIHSQELNKLRQVEKMEKCSRCNLLQYCRGCPAVAYAVSGNYFAPDPQCWKEL